MVNITYIGSRMEWLYTYIAAQDYAVTVTHISIQIDYIVEITCRNRQGNTTKASVIPVC